MLASARKSKRLLKLFDSIITVVGMTEHVAITIVMAMPIAAGPLANFIDHNPTIAWLALGFLLLIGAALIAG